jgi:toxin ParE1/3/4
MENCKFTEEADKDISEIYEYTILNLGLNQAKKNIKDLYSKISMIVNENIQGRKVDIIKKGLRRVEVGSHIVFYQDENELVLIVRVLHNSIDISKHF